MAAFVQPVMPSSRKPSLTPYPQFVLQSKPPVLPDSVESSWPIRASGVFAAAAALLASGRRQGARKQGFRKHGRKVSTATVSLHQPQTKSESENPWRLYGGDWEMHKFGGASLETAELYKTCGELLRDQSRREGGPSPVPTSCVVSAAGGMTDALVQVVFTGVADLKAARSKMREVEKRQINLLLDLVPDRPELTDGVIDNIKRDAESILSVLLTVKLMRGIPAQLLELVAGMGEVWSAQALATYLKSVGEHAEWMDARDVLIVPETDGGLGEKGQSLETVTPIWNETKDRLRTWWKEKFVPGATAPFVIITGFVCSTSGGRPTTLKRSGSDYSATIFANILGSRSVTMWKNVNGVYTADPRKVPAATPIDEMTFDEAMELSYFGGQVLHPTAMLPCMTASIPVLVRNVFNPSHPGTRVYGRSDDETIESNESRPVKALTSIEKIAMVSVRGVTIMGNHGVAKRMMEALALAGVNVILTSQGSSESSITVAVDESMGDTAAKSVEAAFAMELSRGEAKVSLSKGCSILSIIGQGMKDVPGVAGQFLDALGTAKVNVLALAQGSNQMNVSAVVLREYLDSALRSIHASFAFSEVPVALGVIGCGKVGTELLRMLSEFQSDQSGRNANIPALAELKSLGVQVRAICDGDKMLLVEEGVPPECLSKVDRPCNLEDLHASVLEHGIVDDASIRLEKTDLNAFEQFLNTKDSPHKIIVDCTASEEVAEMCVDWLGKGLHVITPSKLIGSGNLTRFREIVNADSSKAGMWFQGAAVGAQLPVISLIHDLLQTGDSVRRIEGIMSGTLGYVFSRLEAEPGLRFSDAVQEASERGLTETDIVLDLTGEDAARKALILAREIGMMLELSDVEFESLLPKSWGSMAADTPIGQDKLMNLLRESVDDVISSMLEDTRHSGEHLRYVGEVDVETGSVRVGLRRVSKDNALAGVCEAETVVKIITSRYPSDSPLVLRGRGAGPTVTASGVFATLLRLGQRLT